MLARRKDDFGCSPDNLYQNLATHDKYVQIFAHNRRILGDPAIDSEMNPLISVCGGDLQSVPLICFGALVMRYIRGMIRLA